MKVAILGVGPFGRRLAHACASAGQSVAISGADANDILDVVDAIGVDSAGAQVDGTTALQSALGDADVVVETRGGDTEEIRDRLAAIETDAPEDALLVFAAVQRPVTEAAVALQDPTRFVGLHEFFTGEEPAGASPVEVVHAEQTSEDAIERASTFVSEIGWTPLVVGDGPGFVATRLRLALQAEAMRLVETGVADVTAIDQSMTEGFGHTLGPLELADRQGLDNVADALRTLAETLGPRYEPPAILEEKIQRGHLGKRRGEGFYEWN